MMEALGFPPEPDDDLFYDDFNDDFDDDLFDDDDFLTDVFTF